MACSKNCHLATAAEKLRNFGDVNAFPSFFASTYLRHWVWAWSSSEMTPWTAWSYWTWRRSNSAFSSSFFALFPPAYLCCPFGCSCGAAGTAGSCSSSSWGWELVAWWKAWSSSASDWGEHSPSVKRGISFSWLRRGPSSSYYMLFKPCWGRWTPLVSSLCTAYFMGLEQWRFDRYRFRPSSARSRLSETVAECLTFDAPWKSLPR